MKKHTPKTNDVAELQFGDLLGYGVTTVVIVLVLAFGATILADIKTDTDDPAALQVIGNGSAGLAKLGSKIPIIMTVIVAAIIIGILVTSFYFKMRG
jgi:hypothetical protein